MVLPIFQMNAKLLEISTAKTKGVSSWGVENCCVSHRMCRKDVGMGFWILIKKQITEPIRKLRDESNDNN